MQSEECTTISPTCVLEFTRSGKMVVVSPTETVMEYSLSRDLEVRNKRSILPSLRLS